MGLDEYGTGVRDCSTCLFNGHAPEVYRKSYRWGVKSYPMVPCCPCVSVRRNQGRLTKSLNEGTHLFLRQNAVECRYKVAHGSLTVASYHIIDSLDMTDVVSLASSPNMGLI